MLLEARLATMTSSLPSRFTSGTMTTTGEAPTEYETGGWKVPSPLPSRMLMALAFPSTTTRSLFASPLKRPTATEIGPLPAAKAREARNEMFWPFRPALPASTSRKKQTERKVMDFLKRNASGLIAVQNWPEVAIYPQAITRTGRDTQDVIGSSCVCQFYHMG